MWRSAYRTAILADINTLDVKVESFCAVLFESLMSRYREPKPSDRASVMAAHLTAMAVACQEIHRGRPHATFQIGDATNCCCSVNLSRRPLSIWSKMMTSLSATTNKIIAEITELKQALFHGGEHVTVVSFVQSLAMMWAGSLAATKPKAKSSMFASGAEELFNDVSANVIGESFDHRGSPGPAQRADPHQLEPGSKALMRLWYIGFLREDPRENQQMSIFESGKLTKVLLDPLGSKPQAPPPRIGCTFLSTSPLCDPGNISAVVADRNISTPDMNCDLFYLFSDLQSALEDANRNEPPERLLTAHLAAMVAATMA